MMKEMDEVYVKVRGISFGLGFWFTGANDVFPEPHTTCH